MADKVRDWDTSVNVVHTPDKTNSGTDTSYIFSPTLIPLRPIRSGNDDDSCNIGPQAFGIDDSLATSPDQLSSKKEGL